jgi:hypothetical protein
MAIHIDNGFPAFGTFVQAAAGLMDGVAKATRSPDKRRIPAATDVKLSQTIAP